MPTSHDSIPETLTEPIIVESGEWNTLRLYQIATNNNVGILVLPLIDFGLMLTDIILIPPLESHLKILILQNDVCNALDQLLLSFFVNS